MRPIDLVRTWCAAAAFPRWQERLQPLPDHPYPVDRLSGESFGPGDFADACGLSEHRLSHPQFALLAVSKTLTTDS
jgi:hypothetical protein